MNDRFLSIFVAKIEVWISISIFLAPKMSTAGIGLTEKVPRRRAVRRHNRQLSIQVIGVWWERRPGRAMVKAAQADTNVPPAMPSTPMPYVIDSRSPAIRGAGDLRQTTALPVPARHSNACQRSTDVWQHELSVSILYFPTVSDRW